MLLSELIQALEAMPQDKVVEVGIWHPHSYRGYDDELAFEPAENIRISDMLAAAKAAVGETYEGRKGGQFRTTGDTPVWLAYEGRRGEAITPAHLMLWREGLGAFPNEYK